MHRAVLILSICSTVACSSEAQIELSAAGAKTFILARSVEGGTPGLEVHDAATALRVRVEPGRDLETVIVAYAEEPAALELAVGPLATASAAPWRALPPSGTIYRASLAQDGSGEVVVTTVDALPERLANLRIPRACRSAAPSEPMTFVEGCVPARPPECWAPFERIDALTPAPITIGATSYQGFVEVGSVRDEGGEQWLYVSRAASTAHTFTRHFAIPLLSPRSPDLSRARELATLPALEESMGAWSVRGWASAMHVRRDGLEAFFSGSYPDAVWQDEDAFVATRVREDAPWTLAVNAAGLGDERLDDPASQHKILGDFQTVLSISPNRGNRLTPDGELVTRVLVHWRAETRGLSFREVGALARRERESDYGIRALNVSCDGGHILFWERSGPNSAGSLRIAPIVAMPTPDASDAPKGNVELGESTEIPWSGGELTSFVESPDCRYLYVSTHTAVYVTERVRCE